MFVLTFPHRTYHFNDHPLFDFQLNRWSCGTTEDRRRSRPGREIKDFSLLGAGLKGASFPPRQEARED